MGCDYITTKDGELEIIFRNNDGDIIDTVKIDSMETKSEIYVEIEKGNIR